MNLQVIYQDNKMGEIDTSLLNDMITTNKIKMFRRSDGWAMVGVAHTRGDGGLYDGVDRRGKYGVTGDIKYKIVT